MLLEEKLVQELEQDGTAETHDFAACWSLPLASSVFRDSRRREPRHVKPPPHRFDDLLRIVIRLTTFVRIKEWHLLAPYLVSGSFYAASLVQKGARSSVRRILNNF